MQKRQLSTDLSNLAKISGVDSDPSPPAKSMAYSPIKLASVASSTPSSMSSSMPSSMASQRKPQFLFSGSQGCVYSSGGFPCKGQPELNKVHENDIMKIQDISSYKEHIAKKILDIDPNQEHFIVENSFCEIDTFNPNLENSYGDKCTIYRKYNENGIFNDGEKEVRLTGYFMKNGGEDLITFCDKKPKDSNLIYILLLSMYDILKAIKLLRENKILHLDIRPENITFNGKKSYLIDFGLALTYDEFIQKLQTDKGYHLLHHLPPFLNVIGTNTTYTKDNKNEHNFIQELIKMRHFGKDAYLLNNRHYGTLFKEKEKDIDKYIEDIIKLIDKIDVFSVGFSYVLLFKMTNLYDKLPDKTREFLQYMIHSNPLQQLDLDTAITYLERIKPQLEEKLYRPIANLAKLSQFIKQGSQGCVFKPAIPCINPAETMDGTNLLMKVQDDVENPAILRFLNSVDPASKYFLYPIKGCYVDKTVLSSHHNCTLKFNNPIGYYMMDGGKDLTQKEKSFILKNFDMIFEHLSKGLKILREKEVIHFDIKPDNIVLSEDIIPRIIDFTLIRQFKTPMEGFITEGMYYYHPPFINLLKINNSNKEKDEREKFYGMCIKQKVYTEILEELFVSAYANKQTYFDTWVKPNLDKIDTWSLGITLRDINDKYLNNPMMKMEPILSEKHIELLNKMTSCDPNTIIPKQ